MLNKEYKSISEIIKDSAELNVIKQTADEYGVVNRFEEIFPELSKVAKPYRLTISATFIDPSYVYKPKLPL